MKLEAPGDNSVACRTLHCLADAHDAAASDLERQEKDLLDKVTAL